MTSSEDRDPLESLFQQAQAAHARKREQASKPLKRLLHEAEARLKAQYAFPSDYWVRTRGVALIHRPTGTVVGNFSEYTHKLFGGTRLLEREHQLSAIDGVEFVEDAWYLGELVQQHIAGYARWETQREVKLDAQLLPEFGLAAPGVELLVTLAWGGICRAELKRETLFAAPSGERMLSLPPGTNVIEVLSLDSKLALRRELAI